MAHVKIAH